MASTVVFLFLALSNVQWAELWAALEAVDWLYLSATSGPPVINLIVRGVRWQILLAPLGTLTAWDASAHINVGYLGNKGFLMLTAGQAAFGTMREVFDLHESGKVQKWPLLVIMLLKDN